MPEDDKIDLSMFLDEFLNDAKEGFERINSALLVLERDFSQRERLDEIFRVVHTLKGSSTMLEFSDIAQQAHLCEDLLDRLRKDDLELTSEIIDVLFEVTDTLEAMVKARAGRTDEKVDFRGTAEKLRELLAGHPRVDEEAASKKRKPTIPTIETIQTIRVDVDLLDSLFNLVGELIIIKNRIDNIASGLPEKDLKAALARMNRMIRELQENVSVARLVPVNEIFRRFPRMVRDLAKAADKEIDLVLEGADIELDKSVLDALSEPLIHLLRNAVDHGIESAETRRRHGKRKSGTIRLTAGRGENHILVEAEDDGGGINISRLRELLVGRGLLTAEEAKTARDRDVLDLMFEPGVSTAKGVTGLSGRGVGLDVVRNSIAGLGGTVRVSTREGKGTRFTLELPLTTAIMQTLMVGVGQHVYAIPTDVVLETLQVEPEDIREIGDGKALVFREEVIPFVTLREALSLPSEEGPEGNIVVVLSRGDELLGLGVDAVLDQMENIIKPFDPIAQEFKDFAGGTILGDGRVALLLDVASLVGLGLQQRGMG